MEFKLSKKVTFEGKDYESVVLDLDGLRGEDMDAVDDQLEAMGTISMAKAQRLRTALILARASGVPHELFRALPAPDYEKLKAQVMVFLYS